MAQNVLLIDAERGLSMHVITMLPFFYYYKTEDQEPIQFMLRLQVIIRSAFRLSMNYEFCS